MFGVSTRGARKLFLPRLLLTPFHMDARMASETVIDPCIEAIPIERTVQ